MSWPTPADFQEAIQHPAACFSDPELQAATAATDRWGLPRPVSGAFASVYQLAGGGQKHAVRCFLRPVPDIDRRYAIIGEYLSRVRLPFMVEFQYLARGICVRGQWYPILKMDWVEGERLDTYIARNLNNPLALLNLANRFLKLTHDLERACIAHGDLQHGNILVVAGTLRLIDYDGMYVPGLEQWASIELGQPNFQHPRRTEQDFGLYLDHFSEWVIYLTLAALAIDPGLRQRFSPGNEYLLLSRDDLLDPRGSRLLEALEQNRDPALQALAQRLASFLFVSDLRQVPSLEPPVVLRLPEPEPAHGLPGWLADQVAPLPAAAPAPGPGASLPGADWVFEQQPLVPFHITASTLFERTLLLTAAVMLVLLGLGAAAGLAETTQAALLMGSISAAATLGLTVRFNLLPETRARNKRLGKFRSCRAEVQSLEAELRHLHDRVGRLENERRGTIQSLETRERESLAAETKGILDIRKRRQARLDALAKERLAIKQAEEQARKQIVERKRQEMVQSRLTGYSLSASNPPGLGQAGCATLRRYGISTVADILDIQVLPASGGSTEPIVQVRTPRQGWVSVPGITGSQARLALAWRRVLETRLAPQIKPSVSLAESAWLASRSAAQIRLTEYREKQTVTRAAEDEERMHTRYREERESVQRRLKNLPGEFEPQERNLEREIAEKKKKVLDMQRERARLERELQPYREVNFPEYLRRIWS